MKPILTLFSLLFLAYSPLFAAELKGTVRDAETGESLPGANVYIEGVERGATTDLDGQFAIANVGAGSHTLVVSFIGYKEHRSPVVVEADAVELFVELMPEVFRGKEIIIVADRATDVPKADMQRKLGSRDLPLILNDTPGVYATAQGGGAGDSRINVRGFDQRNVAVMINGVPVNDMENGWVYWSNWDGLSDVTSGASNLAIASVGGTMNIITDIASQRRGFKIKQEAGNNAFYKTTLNFSSGLIDKKTAFTVGMTRKSSEGLPAQAWSSAWAYFGALSFLASDTHKIDLFVTGAPQRHGHRLYKQSIATFDADYAQSLGIDVADARNYGVDYNPNWGRSPFSSYQEYYNGSVHDARDSAIIMERENFYHKPQANLNWYWTPNAQFMLSNVFYFSRGKGGGTGRLGSNPGTLPDGSINWQRVADELNTQADSALVAAGEVGADEIAAQTIIRNSVNQHFWYGYLGTAEYHLSDIYKLTFGTDLRYYKGEHWREVRNLLGADYYVSVKRLGDRVAYHNDGLTRWGGGFAQLEGQFDKFTAFLSTSVSTTGYKRIDYFRAKIDGDWDQTAWENFPGYTMKVGGNYNATPTVNVYANMGWLSTAPKFDSVYHYDNSLYDPTFNEKVASFELGAGYFKRGMFTGNANFYYTRWIDRSWPKSIYSDELEQSFRFLLNGIDALHTGVEFDLKARPHDKFEVRGMVSLGNWEWLNDVNTTFSPEEDPETIGEFQVYAKGLKVGDAAQKTLALSGAVFPTRGLYASLGVRRFMDHYAKFDPANRTDPDDRAQSWKLPDYNLVDLHAGYTLPGASFSNMKLRLHVFNLLDENYVSDADDGDGHDAASARVFLGLGRRWNISLSYDY
ncbi:MAG: TonB-dependent receptor [Candidatus Latescibacteria bacterium]|nr:TonB-dependent receptor [Candidatus Latescibacterota bacterium]